jgi:hypothetical protein
MNDLQTLDPAAPHTAVALMMDPAKLQNLMSFAEMMAKSAITVPQHLRGKPADCMAIAMQAAQWRMNPFAVAQKTHVTPGGVLGYEAQLVNAVIVNSGALDGRPENHFLGDWDKILGRVAAWKREDEVGLGVDVVATLRGEREPRRVRVMLSQAYPRFSTQWATDPQQQITYLALRKFARRYVPDAILGVYTADELDAASMEAPASADEVMADGSSRPLMPTRTTTRQRNCASVIDASDPPLDDVTPAPSTAAAAQTPGNDTAELATDGHKRNLELKAKAAGIELPLVLQRLGIDPETLTIAQFNRAKAELSK